MTTILLVEDNPLNRMVIEDIMDFDQIPADLVCVETGEEAITIVEQSLPTLILMDIQLPGIDGLETVAALKRNPRTQHIPVWGITAQAMAGAKEKALEMGFERYITKPFDSAKLARELRDKLAEKTLPRSEVVGKPSLSETAFAVAIPTNPRS